MAAQPRRRTSPPALPDTHPDLATTMAAPPPPPLPGELIEEILLRLPPDDPACLLRASLVCKTWSGIVSQRAFRRRLHELHGAPPVLGFLHNWDDEVIPRFIPTTASSFSLAAPHRQFWRAIDCRHGRALFLSEGEGTQELLLWEPITGVRQHVPVPAAYDYEMTMFQPSAAVLCAADGCDHRDCLGGPFCLVFVFSIEEDTDDEEYVTSACVYSSETGTWGELTSMHVEFLIDFTYYSRVLVARSLVYFMATGGSILEYDLARHHLNVFEPPDYDLPHSERFKLVLAEDGGLGVSQALDSHLKFWSREAASNGTDARWVLSRVIHLQNLLPMRALARADYRLLVLGFAEGANVIFVNTVAGLFTIELQSERVRKVCDDHGFCNLIPVVGFYTPRSRLEAPRDEHRDLLPPMNITEEVGGEEEDKTLQMVRKLFDKWCKDIEVGDFGNATDFFSHALEIRVPVSPECASTFYRCGRALLCKAMKATNPSRNGSKSSSNEESIKSTATASKDDTEGSEAFGSNFEQASSEKFDSEEGRNLNGKDQEDENMAGSGFDSDLDLAWKMLNVARAIVTKSPDMTMEKVNIYHALAEVCKKREDRDNTIGYYFKALAILEHLFRSDHIRIVDLNARICVAFELASKLGDAITYCAKAISVCKSRIQNLENAKEDLLADNDVYTSAAEGSSGNRSPEDEISFLTGILARLQKKLQELEQAMSTPSSGVDRTMKRAVSVASQEQNVKNTVAGAASLTSSQMARSNHSFRSPTMCTAATTGSIGSGVTYVGIVSTGMKQLMKSMSLLQRFLQRMIHHP